MQMGYTFIISGKKGEGKTGFAMSLIAHLLIKSINVRGFFSKGYWNNDTRSHFDLVDINSNNTTSLCTRTQVKDWTEILGYYFNPDAIEKGYKIINEAIADKADLILIDEAGKIEMKKMVWYNGIKKILATPNIHLILCVRENFIAELTGYFSLKNVHIFDIAETTAEKASVIIENKLLTQ
jgi:nucleoside-triphosphatase THEP1